MVVVAIFVWMRPGGLCVSVQLDTSSLPMELSVKVCDNRYTKHWLVEVF